MTRNISVSRITIRHIEVFHAVYVNGSVTSAARVLSVSQPTVSTVLKHAETRLGFALFRRLGNRMVPSDEAHVLFREVDELYRRLDSINVTAQNLCGGSDGHIRLAVPPALGFGVVTTAVSRFCARNPKISFDIQTRLHEDTAQSLCERESDLAFGYVAPQHPKLSSTQVGTGELVVLFRRGQLKGAAKKIRLDALAATDFIGLSAGPLGDLVSAAIEEHLSTLKCRLTVHTSHLAAALVHAGLGVAIVDEFTAKAPVAAGLEHQHLEPPVYFGIHAVFLAERPPSGNIKRFVDTVKTVIAAK